MHLPLNQDNLLRVIRRPETRSFSLRKPIKKEEMKSGAEIYDAQDTAIDPSTTQPRLGEHR